MKLETLFPRKYATGADLAGKDVTLIISHIDLEQMHTVPNKPPEHKPVIYFEKAGKGIILTRTLAGQIAEIVRSTETDEWTGKKVTLYPFPCTVAGQPRIAIRAKPPTNGTTPPPPELQDEEE